MMNKLLKNALIGVTAVGIVATAFIGITFSKYTNKISGDGETEIAKWSFKVNEETEEFATIKLAETYDKSSLLNGKIAPGSSGSFDLIIDATDSEVGVKYEVDFQNETNKPSNLKFIYNGNTLDSIEDLDDYFTDVIDVEDYKSNKLIINYKKHKSNKIDYLLKDDFKIILGINDKGEKKILDFNIIPHITISSASGGGKTTLFKSIFMQSYLKGAKIIIADFKGGLDFNKGWDRLGKERCKIITDVKTLWDYVSYDLPDIANERKALLNRYNCESAKEYNEKIDKGEIVGEKIQRIVIGLDEAAQVFIKSKNKDEEEKLQQIRGKIENISSLYRAININLVISTQVPSSSVLTEAVRHNAVLRICGRANKILSQVAIEKDIASTISANDRGRFATNEDKDCFFQGYLFYEKDVFPELKENK